MNDRIVISKGGIKREITFPFELCLSRDAAAWLRKQLLQKDNDQESGYGWISIAHPIDMQGKPNTMPLRWEDTTSVENQPSGINK
mgnify:CR=1 FL=1